MELSSAHAELFEIPFDASNAQLRTGGRADGQAGRRAGGQMGRWAVEWILQLGS